MFPDLLVKVRQAIVAAFIAQYFSVEYVETYRYHYQNGCLDQCAQTLGALGLVKNAKATRDAMADAVEENKDVITLMPKLLAIAAN